MNLKGGLSFLYVHVCGLWPSTDLWGSELFRFEQTSWDLLVHSLCSSRVIPGLCLTGFWIPLQIFSWAIWYQCFTTLHGKVSSCITISWVFVTIVFCPVIVRCWGKSDSLFFIPSCWVFIHNDRCPLSILLSRLKSQSFLSLLYTFQSLNHLCSPLLGLHH